MQYVQRKLQRSVTEIRRSRSGRPRESSDIPPTKLNRGVQKLQDLSDPARPRALAVIAARILRIGEIRRCPAFRAQAIAKRAGISQSVPPLPPAPVQPHPRARALAAHDFPEDPAVVPPYRG